MKLSAYVSMFNIQSCVFDARAALQNFCAFADEVVVATLQDVDESCQILQGLAAEFPNLKVVMTDLGFDDPLLDGKIKDAALQQTSHELCLQMDADERLCLWQKDKWLEFGEWLLGSSEYQALMIPTIDLYEDVHHYFHIGYKWRLHKRGLHRGPVIWGRKMNGHVDVTKSDTTELIDSEGRLVNSFQVSAADLYTFHLGYLVLEDRVRRNAYFWKKHWSLEAGEDVPVPLSINDLQKDRETKKHRFRLW